MTLHSGMTVSKYFAMHFQAAVFPVTAGMLFYGWRAIVLMGLVVGGAAAGIWMWRRIRGPGQQITYQHGLWLALLLSLTLPAHLASHAALAGVLHHPLWPMLPAAGIALVILSWLLGGTGTARVHPVLLTHLLLVVLFRGEMLGHCYLQRQYVFTGDLINAVNVPTTSPRAVPVQKEWLVAPALTQADGTKRDAIWRQPASQLLLSLTSRSEAPSQTTLSLEGLLRDLLPPLEDLIVGGHPGPLGATSAVAVVVGGLFLMYRGLVDYRIPLLIFAGAFLALLVLPIPTLITQGSRHWHWLALRQSDVGWAMGITFVNYQLLAGPMLFMAFFLATASAVRPLVKRARALYALLLGIVAAVLQLYFSVSLGPYVALLLVSLLTPTFDRCFRPRLLV
jgi:Na+-translocating ferredoxin:NAD+ oxidoreductase RnfD subunit